MTNALFHSFSIFDNSYVILELFLCYKIEEKEMFRFVSKSYKRFSFLLHPDSTANKTYRDAWDH